MINEPIMFRVWDREALCYPVRKDPFTLTPEWENGVCLIDIPDCLEIERFTGFYSRLGKPIFVGDVLAEVEEESVQKDDVVGRILYERRLEEESVICPCVYPDKVCQFTYLWLTGRYSTPLLEPMSDRWLEGTFVNKFGQADTHLPQDWEVVGTLHDEKWAKMAELPRTWEAGFWEDEKLADSPR